MIQSMIDGIIAAIRTEYDNSYRIYTESVKQGLKEPCFTILCLTPSNEHILSDRYRRSHKFIVQYFPQSKDDPISECMNVCDILFDILEGIAVDGALIRGNRMSGNVVDGVLQFEVTYAMFAMVLRQAEEDMDDVQVNVDAR